MVSRSASIRAELARALIDGVADPPDDAVDDWLVAARREGVTALLARRLTQQTAPSTPRALTDALMAEARQIAMLSLFRIAALRRVADLLRQLDLPALLLKGQALAMWLYPEPHLRAGGDIDLLVRNRSDADRLCAALGELGYRVAYAPGSLHYETTCRLFVDGVQRLELDVHCRLINAPVYADRLPFDTLWCDALPLPDCGPQLRRLSGPHALIHACMNRALDALNGEPDRLKLVHDLHLFMTAFSSEDWNVVVTTARDAGLAGVCLYALADVGRLYGDTLPVDVASALRSAVTQQSLDPSRLTDWRYMQWQNLRALPSLWARAQWLFQRIWPSHAQLRELYGEGSRTTLLARRLRRGIARVLNHTD